jgi:transposase
VDDGQADQAPGAVVAQGVALRRLGERAKPGANTSVVPPRASALGSTGRPIRAYCRRRGIRHTIPRRRTERPARRFDRAASRERNRVERLVGRLKQCRRVATRYEKRAANFVAMVTLAAILLWL